MDYQQMIAALNKRTDIAHIKVAQLDTLSLSEEEKNFLRQYLPEQVLIIYGTLAPGKPNHIKIAHIKGNWTNATVNGILENKGWGAALGFNGFRHVAPGQSAQVIEAQVLHSTQLNDYWALLDDFEGNGYKRILAPYTLADQTTRVGYIYAIND